MPMPRTARSAWARYRALLRTDAVGVRAGFVALMISSAGDLVAGITLGSVTGTLERLPGLLVLVPAAIGMRGNVFGALGSRLGTAIHAGTFRFSRRRDTVVGQNLAASIVLSLVLSLALAVLARAVSLAFGLDTISLADFVVVSVLGGVASSFVVLGVTVVVARAAADRGWDLDNVAAPVVTAAGDVVTLPSLFLATYLVGFRWVTPVLAAACVAAAAAALVGVLRSGLPVLRRIVLESLPVLLVAGAVDVVAGLTIERRFESFLAYPALLVLVPPFLEDSGALGGILSARVGSKLHLGTLELGRSPVRGALPDVMLVFTYAVPVFLVLGVSADVAAAVAGLASPGLAAMVGVALLAGSLATTAAVAVGLGSAVAAFRLGLDPDSHSIPVVTSSLDLIGAVSLMLAIVALGLT